MVRQEHELVLKTAYDYQNYQDFIKNGVNGGYEPIIQKPKSDSTMPPPNTTPTEKLSLWELYRKYSTGSAS